MDNKEKNQIEHNHKILNKNFMIVAFIIAIVMAFIILISIAYSNNIHL